MALSKKGLLTEIDIIESAKYLFYEFGYLKTSMRDICAHADVKLGTLTYYFKKKEDLARRIYSDNVIRLYSFIRKNNPKKMSSIQLNFMMTCHYQHCYSIDKKTSDFHLEIVSHEQIYASIYQQIFAPLYATMFRDISRNMPSRELEVAIAADLCVKKELSTLFLRKIAPKDFRDLFTDSATIMGRIFKLPEVETQLYIQESINFFNTHDSSSIKLLI